MKYEQYLKLKNLNILKIKNFITDIKDDIAIEEEQMVFVSLSYCAIFLKENKEVDLLIQHIEELTSKTKMEKIKPLLTDLIFTSKELLLDLSISFAKEELMAFSLNVPMHKYLANDYIETPNSLSKLVIELLDLNKQDVLLELGSGIGEFLFDIVFQSSVKKIIGVDNNLNNCIVSILRNSLLNLNIKFINEDIFEKNIVKSVEANKIFSHALFTSKYRELAKEDGKENYLNKLWKDTGAFNAPYSAEWAFILTAVKILEKNTNARIVMLTSKSIFEGNREREYRNYLIDNQMLEGIITLPESLMSFTRLETEMMVLSNNNKNIKMVDATKCYSRDRRNNVLLDEDIESIINAYKNETEISASISYKTIKNNEFIVSTRKYLNKPELSVGHVYFDDVISEDIQRGAIMFSKDLSLISTEEKTDIQYLELRNIKNGKISKDLTYITKLENKWENFCVENGQLIISKLSPFKTVVVEKDEKTKLLATGNLYFMSVDKTKMNPYFIAAYLESEIGQKELDWLSAGSVIKNLSITALKKVRIPMLNMKEQDRIAELYKNANDDIFSFEVEIKKREEIKKQLFKNLI